MSDSITEWVQQAPIPFLVYMQSMSFKRFIADERRRLFNMQGAYDGAMSAVCKKLIADEYAAVTELQKAIAIVEGGGKQ